MKVVIVCGDRNWRDVQTMLNRFKKLPKDTHIIHGDCKGADSFAAAIAKSMGFKVTAYPANWKKFGNKAGPKRNELMLGEGPDLVIAFHNNLRRKSKGTKDMVLLALDAGIPVEVIREKK